MKRFLALRCYSHFLFPAVLLLAAAGYARTYHSSMESLSPFYNQGWYVISPGDYGSSHAITAEAVVDSCYSHKAWILAARASTNDGAGASLPHRAYPSFAFQKTPQGTFKTPALITFYAWVDIKLQVRTGLNDWFSPITVTPDSTTAWARVVTLTVGPEGYLQLMHVPLQNERILEYQASPANGGPKFPMRKLVRIDFYIDFDPKYGYAKAWQDGKLVSYGLVSGGNGRLAQMHLGLYSSAATHYAIDGKSPAVVYNDNVTITEVADESQAMASVNNPPALHSCPGG
jgi:hypothetical protein